MKINNLFLATFFSLIYAWSILQLPILSSIDSVNYLYYAHNSFLVLVVRFDKGIVYGLLNEPVWLLINYFFAFIFNNNPKSVVFALSFLVSFSLCFYSYRFNIKVRNIPIVFFLLLFPMLIANSVVNIRGGVALVIFLLAFFSKNKKLKYFLFLLTPFIHISFSLIIIFYFLVSWISNIKVTTYSKIALIFLAILFLSIFLNNVSSDAIRQLGNTHKISFSGIGFLFWFIFFLIEIIFLDIKKFFVYDKKFYLLGISFLIFYLMNYFVFYGSARIVQVGLFFIILSLFYLKYIGRLFGSSMLLLFLIHDWYNRLSDKGLGF